MPGFRFSNKRVLLTYSTVSESITKEAIFYTIDERYPVEEYCVGEERHQDGQRHIHAVFSFKKKVDSKDVTLFDVNDGNETFHPNIAPIKKGKAHFERATEYTKKEDPEPLCNIMQAMTWGDLIEGSTSKEEFLELVRVNYPRDFALNLQRLEYMAEKRWVTPSMNTINDSMQVTWITLPNALLTFEPLINKSVVVIGPAGCGKTSWAKFIAPKPCLFVRHLDSLSQLLPIHQSIIFDDLAFGHLPVATQKYLVDMENLAEIHIRYKVAKIPAGVLRIITANTDPFTAEGEHRVAIDRRCQLIDLYYQ